MGGLLGALHWGTPEGNKSTVGIALGETSAQSRRLGNNRRWRGTEMRIVMCAEDWLASFGTGKRKL